MISHAVLHDPGLPPRSLSRIGIGVALSLAAHALLLFAYRFNVFPGATGNPAPTKSIEVRLVAPAPPIAEPEPAPAVAARPAAREPRRTSARPAPADVIALPENAPDKPADTATFTVAPPQEAAPKFDPDAARKLARQMANEPDPARAGTALAQLPPRPLETETRAARVISRAKRADCKDQFASGNLLTPLTWLLDGKGSGCKF